jgi:hypothetical protein
MGLTPLIVETVDDVVRELQRGFFAAVLLDRTDTNVGALEFVQNVRDVDTAVPIVISDPSRGDFANDVLSSLGHVHRIDPPETPEQAAEALEDILEGRETG